MPIKRLVTLAKWPCFLQFKHMSQLRTMCPYKLLMNFQVVKSHFLPTNEACSHNRCRLLHTVSCKVTRLTTSVATVWTLSAKHWKWSWASECRGKATLGRMLHWRPTHTNVSHAQTSHISHASHVSHASHASHVSYASHVSHVSHASHIPHASNIPHASIWHNTWKSCFTKLQKFAYKEDGANHKVNTQPTVSL